MPRVRRDAKKEAVLAERRALQAPTVVALVPLSQVGHRGARAAHLQAAGSRQQAAFS